MTKPGQSDPLFTISVSDDAMTAELHLNAAATAGAVDPTDVFDALAAVGVIAGIDAAAVLAACTQAGPGSHVVARGDAPIHGSDSRFEPLVSETRDRAPRISDDGLVDFRELGAIPMVAHGQPLMRRHPPSGGSPGMNLRGEAVPPTPGQVQSFAPDLCGAQVSPEDPDLLIATASGQPVLAGNGVTIEQVLQVPRVDVASGHLAFDGTIEVAGDVLPGMRVQATGDIIVKGAVEGGELDAQGDVRIDGGVIAKGRVRSRGSVTCRFVEGASLHAGTWIAVDDNALQSELEALNAIRIGVRAPQRGRLSGGIARAMMLIEVPCLGAESGVVTRIELGVNADLDARWQEVLQKIEQQKAGEAKLKTLLKHLTTHGDKDGLLARVRASWQASVQTWARLLPERDALEAQRVRMADARLQVGVEASGAIDLSVGTRSARLRKDFGPGQFRLDVDRIVFHAHAVAA